MNRKKIDRKKLIRVKKIEKMISICDELIKDKKGLDEYLQKKVERIFNSVGGRKF
jgi:hypothetical protein